MDTRRGFLASLTALLPSSWLLAREAKASGVLVDRSMAPPKLAEPIALPKYIGMGNWSLGSCWNCDRDDDLGRWTFEMPRDAIVSGLLLDSDDLPSMAVDEFWVGDVCIVERGRGVPLKAFGVTAERFPSFRVETREGDRVLLRLRNYDASAHMVSAALVTGEPEPTLYEINERLKALVGW